MACYLDPANPKWVELQNMCCAHACRGVDALCDAEECVRLNAHRTRQIDPHYRRLRGEGDDVDTGPTPTWKLFHKYHMASLQFILAPKEKKNVDAFRKVIVATVASDPEKYSEAFLGKTNQEYCAWILNPEKMGRLVLYIELAILADYYGREIAAYDIQTTICDLYGQEKNFGERVMLIYDGLHYDALAMSPIEGAPEEFDPTIITKEEN